MCSSAAISAQQKPADRDRKDRRAVDADCAQRKVTGPAMRISGRDPVGVRAMRPQNRLIDCLARDAADRCRQRQFDLLMVVVYRPTGQSPVAAVVHAHLCMRNALRCSNRIHERLRRPSLTRKASAYLSAGGSIGDCASNFYDCAPKYMFVSQHEMSHNNI